MKHSLLTMFISLSALGAGGTMTATAQTDDFKYTNEQFADIQMLRYKVEGFEKLSLRQKTLIYHLSEAALAGRDILFDQNGRYNLRIRDLLETVYRDYKGDRKSKDFQALTLYLKRVWFSAGIHHHYGNEKFEPGFSEQWLRTTLAGLNYKADDEVLEAMFNPNILKMRVNQKDGDDLVLTSAGNYYGHDVTQAEAEQFYAQRKPAGDPRPVMMGLNSRLVRGEYGFLEERVWRVGGLYGSAIEQIVKHLEAAEPFAENEQQAGVIRRLIEYYRTGDLRTFDKYSIQWLKDTESLVDFVNGFTETYGDPLGMKASWESIVNFKDIAATERAHQLAVNAQWFENHSPVDSRFKKKEVKGISAKVITAAILAGDLYPSTAIGINLPNSDWVRRDFGSKSVTISNLTSAYAKAAHGSGMDKEFIIDEPTRQLILKYGDRCDDLHTDLHECLGHGSGQLLPGTDPDSLKSYGSTIEEARADLFALYYLADPKLVELGLTPNMDAHKASYYSYIQNGALTQLVRIKPGNTIEEAHMRNRALIAHWVLEQAKSQKTAKPCVELVKQKGKTFVRVNDYAEMRHLFGTLLAEIQRIKSEGDYEGARKLVETYGVQVDAKVHKEILDRYARLKLSPYKGFINPVYKAVRDAQGNITDVTISYDEAFDAQNLRYSRDYHFLPLVNE
ncbi:dipeptidyl-peptidase 3 family protein [Alloprevotella sp. oral taxon 473]|uniref:dipeptidyl-peptidase 3 family protein n=1 Tax=Alloprevotella sp. oral taxon 473 TaxID=712469 RepID=UPI0002A27512|nr:peptidase family M49 [Alloprevotella sp. oral taxon 473]EKX89584.1 peptidase family M49 [Alloprevotella sp. oral taxon 473 str. F0040]